MQTKENLIVDYPAYAIYKMPEWKRQRLAHGQTFALPFETRTHGTQWHFFTLGSVFGCAVADGRDVLEAYERAKGFGHKIHWANANAVCITSHKQEKRNEYALEWGAEVVFEGKRFKLAKANNENVELVPVE